MSRDNTNFADTVTLTSRDSQAVLPANYTFKAADQAHPHLHRDPEDGRDANHYRHRYHDGRHHRLPNGYRGQAGAATHLVIGGPSVWNTRTAFAISVTALDAYGNVATGYTGAVHFTDSGQEWSYAARKLHVHYW